jgi:hypothetical protein
MRVWMRWLLSTGLVVPLLLAGACGSSEETQAPPPTPTIEAYPITLANAHCFTCHTRGSAVFVPLSSQFTLKPVTHPTEQREDCLLCHASGATFPFPEDHARALSQACQTCHTPAQIPNAGVSFEGSLWPHPSPAVR